MKVAFTLNGKAATWSGQPVARLAMALRDDLGPTGTKVGCDAGDCGACTVLLDGRQICSCLVAMGQIEGRQVETVESLSDGDGRLRALQQAFLVHGAAQCGICTPGMLMAAEELLRRTSRPRRAEVEEALGGVLCRCTGYAKIVEAVMATGAPGPGSSPPVGTAVGARMARVDGVAKVTGREAFGADAIPADALWIRVVRSPHARARFALGDLAPLRKRLAAVLTAADVPFNAFGIYPDLKDQPVLADGAVRYRGEAVVALVGPRDTVLAVRDDEVPIAWIPEPPLVGIDAATLSNAPLVQAGRPGNLLVEGGVRRGNPAEAFAGCAIVAEGSFETAFVEHVYIELEAGWARRLDDRVEVHVSTQTPYMNRDEVANVMQLRPQAVRIVPTACGGGFGGKLDLSVQPLVALAAWKLGRPVACVYTRPESMAATTKRHPAPVVAKFGCDGAGKLVACEVAATFDTGAYASWGPTVANRVPVHAMGPYAVPNVRSWGKAIFTNGPVAGAFRGFGVPQAAIAHEAMMDELADKLGIDRLEFRHRNALRVGNTTATGQTLTHSAGLAQCLDALRPHWRKAHDEVAEFNARAGARRRGVGIGCMWYGLMGEGTFDPPTTPLDADGQGIPYATYAFAAQLATVEVDLELGTVKVLRVVAAHDVGKAINPTLVEGQIQGGIAQGLGLALMEEYLPGRTENLHDYLIPTVGDVPEIDCILVEDHEPLGPSGAKGVGEPGLVPTAPAILGAVHHATGVRVRRVPLLQHRLRAAILAGGGAA